MTDEILAFMTYLFFETGVVPGPIKNTGLLEERVAVILSMIPLNGKEILFNLFKEKSRTFLVEEQNNLKEELRKVEEQINLLDNPVII